MTNTTLPSSHVLRIALKSCTDAAQKTRIRAVMNVVEGHTKIAVARTLCISRTSLTAWVALCEKGGAHALKLGVGGRPEGNPKWDTTIFTDLIKEIDKGGYWSIPRMMEWIKEHKQEDIPEQTVWYHMNKLGYSYKSARPHPVKGNRERQETFKKGASPRSWSK